MGAAVLVFHSAAHDSVFLRYIYLLFDVIYDNIDMWARTSVWMFLRLPAPPRARRSRHLG